MKDVPLFSHFASKKLAGRTEFRQGANKENWPIGGLAILSYDAFLPASKNLEASLPSLSSTLGRRATTVRVTCRSSSLSLGVFGRRV